MATPQAPMPLANQIAAGTSVTIAVTLQAFGPPPSFQVGGNTYNSGNPTATFTITNPTVSMGQPGVNSGAPIGELFDLLDRLWREGAATVA